MKSSLLSRPEFPEWALSETANTQNWLGLSGGKRTVIHYEGGCYSMTSSAVASSNGGTLRCDDRSRHIPIVAVTAFAMGCHRREALDSGCNAYISKPISIVGFLSTVESFLPRLLR